MRLHFSVRVSRGGRPLWKTIRLELPRIKKHDRRNNRRERIPRTRMAKH
jgi:hypothetical protein